MTIAGKMAIITRMHSRSVRLACGRRGAANRCRTMIDPSRPRLASSLVIGEISREYIAIDQTGNYSFRLRPARPELHENPYRQPRDSPGLMNMTLTFKLAD